MDRELPEALVALLRTDLAELARHPLPVLSLVTTLPTGWPHVMYLGPAELLVVDDGSIGIATWSQSRSTAAAIATGKASVQTVLDGVALLVQLHIEDRGEIVVHGQPLRAMRATVAGSVADGAPYATLTTGTTFAVRDLAATLERWSATRDAIRQALTPAP